MRQLAQSRRTYPSAVEEHLAGSMICGVKSIEFKQADVSKVKREDVERADVNQTERDRKRPLQMPIASAAELCIHCKD